MNNFFQPLVNIVCYFTTEACAKRKKRADEIDYNAGFNWAAGEILQGRLSPIESEYLYENPFRRSLFDKGAEDATDLLCKTGFVPDDRI